MERVIVSVKRTDNESARDLELPAGIALGQLVEMVAQALRWPFIPDEPLGGYQVEARPPGRQLRPDETLAQAGAWDGAWLIFHPGQSVMEDSKYTTPPPGPKAGWRRVDDVPPAPPTAPPEPPATPADGFAWKQVDED